MEARPLENGRTFDSCSALYGSERELGTFLRHNRFPMGKVAQLQEIVQRGALPERMTNRSHDASNSSWCTCGEYHYIRTLKIDAFTVAPPFKRSIFIDPQGKQRKSTIIPML